MKKILVTGANGQLGKCIKDASNRFPEMDFIFASREDLNIENESSVSTFFKKHSFDYCVNAAAYTNVEKAESDKKNAYLTNADGVRYLASHCDTLGITLIQISTDYVFDGEKITPYTENDLINPINVYGASKLKGEQFVQEFCNKYFIIRTSWLYSQYGHNFYNTISKHLNAGKELTITTEQTGTPTNANDLADAIIQIIDSNSSEYGIYNYSNKGNATWYDFAKEILINLKIKNGASIEKTNHYRTFAKRPKYSVLDNTKFNKAFNYQSIEWKTSLETLINND